jgi:flagellar assembly protein FliH
MAVIIRAEDHTVNSIRKFDLEALRLERDEDRSGEGVIEELISQAEMIKREKIAEAEREAHRILEEAKAESERIVHQAHQRAQDLMRSAEEEGFKAGFDKGFNEGMQEAQRRLGQMEEALKRMTDELQRAMDEVIRQGEREILQLIRITAEKLALKELSISPEALLSIAERAIRIAEFPRVTLKASPKLISLFREHRAELMDRLDEVESIKVEPDEDLGELDVVVETESKVVDATFSGRVEEIHRAIEEAYEGT